MPMSGEEAATYGVTVSFENAAGERLVVHRSGPRRVAIEQCFAVATGYDSTFRIIAISTPQSIFTDMQGARLPRFGQNLAAVPFPETAICKNLPSGQAMLHTRLLGSSDRRK